MRVVLAPKLEISVLFQACLQVNVDTEFLPGNYMFEAPKIIFLYVTYSNFSQMLGFMDSGGYLFRFVEALGTVFLVVLYWKQALKGDGLFVV